MGGGGSTARKATPPGVDTPSESLPDCPGALTQPMAHWFWA